MSNPAVVAELKRIAEENGGQLRPADVVDAARPLESPLHSRFEWDDNEAAQRYRLWQARQLIAVTVEYIGSGKEAILSRVFVSLTSDRRDAAGYRTIESVMTDKDSRSELLADAMKEMETFQKKYAELKELATVFAEMRKVKQRRSNRRQSATVPA